MFVHFSRPSQIETTIHATGQFKQSILGTIKELHHSVAQEPTVAIQLRSGAELAQLENIQSSCVSPIPRDKQFPADTTFNFKISTKVF